MRAAPALVSAALIACGGQVTSGGDAGAGADSGGGKVCSRDVKSCSDAEYCDYPNDDCGRGGAVGACKAKPTGCTFEYAPVCTCQAQVASNACAAHSAGADLNADGTCMALGGWVTCGARYCDAATSYCQITQGDVPLPDGGLSTTYACLPLPAACKGSTDCACFKGVPICASTCAVSGDGFRVTCLGG